jgi:Cu/Zn superoxide dismutase
VIVDATELVQFSPTVGNQAAGVVTFKSVDEAGGGRAKTVGSDSNSKHAIHIHQYGDLTSEDGERRDHHNPMDHQHALPDSAISSLTRAAMQTSN